MEQYALLKHVGRNEYVVVKYTDHCLGVLAHFLTDGGSSDNFCAWINQMENGETIGKIIFLRKNEDAIIIGLSPTVTNKKDQFKTTKKDLLSYINIWKEKIKNNPHEILLRRNGEHVEFNILEHHVRENKI